MAFNPQLEPFRIPLQGTILRAILYLEVAVILVSNLLLGKTGGMIRLLWVVNMLTKSGVRFS